MQRDSAASLISDGTKVAEPGNQAVSGGCNHPDRTTNEGAISAKLCVSTVVQTIGTQEYSPTLVVDCVLIGQF